MVSCPIMGNKQMTWKNIGETPLQALERFRAEQGIDRNVPMTYAGRLDPMAEGKLLILIGDECKNKDRYLGLDKEYEVEIVFGLSTDTYDALGIVGNIGAVDAQNIEKVAGNISSYIGKFTQSYPRYSSKTVGGKQLHELARNNELPDEMPTKEVEIYSIEILEKGMIETGELRQRIGRMISSVNGDFRQEQILARWRKVFDLLKGSEVRSLPTLKVRVGCSSGTYMRSLAHRIGEDTGCGAFAMSINRTKIVESTR